MPTQKKEAIVAKLQDLLSEATVAVVTDYRGLSVAEISQLRRRLNSAGVKYHVVKNTLTQLAAERAGKSGLASFLQGPTAIAFGCGDVSEPARILYDYARSSGSTISIKGGLLGEQALSPEEVLTLSTLPSKDEMVAVLMREMQAPLSSLLNVLHINVRRFATVLQLRIQKLEGG